MEVQCTSTIEMISYIIIIGTVGISSPDVQMYSTSTSNFIMVYSFYIKIEVTMVIVVSYL